MNVTFLPAIMQTSLDNRWTDRPLNWLDPRLDGTSAYHPHALTAYPNWSPQPFTWEPEVSVFGDSGGFQVMTRGLRLDPRAVVRWQIKHTDVGAILDFPPFTDSGRRSDLSFSEALDRTVRGLRRGLPVYLRARDGGKDFRFWGVVHGRTPDELAEWYDAVGAVHPFTGAGEGWAFKPLPLNASEAVATVLRFARDRGITRIHLFGTGAPLAIETLFALGPSHGIETATFDTASASIGGSFFNFARPTPYGLNWVKERFRDSNGRDSRARDFMLEECGCRSCEFLRADLRDYQDALDPTYWRMRFAFHNVLALLREYDRLRARYAGPRAAVL